MRRGPREALVAAASLLLVAGSVDGAGAQVAVEGELVGASSYVWRGYRLADGPVLQPGLSLALGDSGLGLDLWGSGAITQRAARGAADELDLTVRYAHAFGADEELGLSVGYTQYTFPSALEGQRHSEEVFLSAALDHPAGPQVTAFYDFGLVDGLHLSAEVAPEVALGGSDAPVLGLSAGVDWSDYVGAGLGFHAARASVSLEVARGAFSVAPVLGLSYADRRVNLERTQVWAGVGLGLGR